MKETVGKRSSATTPLYFAFCPHASFFCQNRLIKNTSGISYFGLASCMKPEHTNYNKQVKTQKMKILHFSLLFSTGRNGRIQLILQLILAYIRITLLESLHIYIYIYILIFLTLVLEFEYRKSMYIWFNIPKSIMFIRLSYHSSEKVSDFCRVRFIHRTCMWWIAVEWTRPSANDLETAPQTHGENHVLIEDD